MSEIAQFRSAVWPNSQFPRGSFEIEKNIVSLTQLASPRAMKTVLGRHHQPKILGPDKAKIGQTDEDEGDEGT